VDRDELADLLSALGNPMRIAIVQRLGEGGEGSPSAVANVFEAPLGTVSHHFRALADAGLIELVRTEPRRGAVEHFYVLSGRGRGAWGWLQGAPE
jgi:DNA-binding transcriptional ArsR family regulator